MISFLDTLTGTPCPLCGEPIGDGWSLEEMAPEKWVTICNACWLVLDTDTGK